ncbi:hypothetical protein [Rhizobium sp. SL42]|uniref:hypothetical protein n=1 Tax=Rhizobium sp. SL42 TaxID=2806346 RepID=UPI001F454FBB|nr:hypothetical protein [Rhizobium sp. SL42]UJW74442.1 hypothetical protein IM739_16490 [Rhizobium sp. SL42]
MSDDVINEGSINAFHRMARQRGDGLLPELAAALAQRSQKIEVTNCEIITLPGLHNRKTGPMYAKSPGATALVIEFPAPKWQRNALRQGT